NDPVNRVDPSGMNGEWWDVLPACQLGLCATVDVSDAVENIARSLPNVCSQGAAKSEPMPPPYEVCQFARCRSRSDRSAVCEYDCLSGKSCSYVEPPTDDDDESGSRDRCDDSPCVEEFICDHSYER